METILNDGNETTFVLYRTFQPFTCVDILYYILSKLIVPKADVSIGIKWDITCSIVLFLSFTDRAHA